MNRIIRKIALLLVPLGLTGSLVAGSGTAHAISPSQTREEGVTYYLAGGLPGSIQTFWANQFRAWGRTYYKPGVYFYNGYGTGDYGTACGNTANLHDNGFYCAGNNSIFLDYSYMNRLIALRGDYAAGTFLAHEWGHRIQHLLNWNNNTFRQEYNADCLAGMYTRYGYSTGRLTGNDYWEGVAWLQNTWFSKSHGIPSDRVAWFKYGYSQYNINDCYRTYNIGYQYWEGSVSRLAPRSLNTPVTGAA